MTSQSDPLPGVEGDVGGGTSFGVNAAEVWTFLGELRDLDLDRAIRVWEGYVAARSGGYERALRAAEKLARKRRPGAWLLAREAAAVAVRERLPAPIVTSDVVDVLANVAGGIVVRDLLSPRYFELLQRPWTWPTDAAATPTPFAVAGAAIASDPQPETAGSSSGGGGRSLGLAWRRLRVRTLVPVVVGLVALIGVTTALAATLLAPAPRGGVAVLGPPSTASASVTPTSSVVTWPDASAVAVTSPSPLGTPAASAPTPTASPRAPTRTTEPIVAATRAPVATPAPTRTPRPTQQPQCSVISLLGVPTAAAQTKWTDAGFSGAVSFAPAVPPHYVIAWQSLAAGRSVACTSGITVSDVAP